MKNRKTSERSGKTYMIWCWVKGAEPGELCAQQWPQCTRVFSGRLRTSLQCRDLKKIPNGLLRQNAFHIQRKNYGIQSQNVADHFFFLVYILVCYMISPIHFDSSTQHDYSENVFNRNVCVEPIQNCMPSWGKRGKAGRREGKSLSYMVVIVEHWKQIKLI